MLGEVSAVLWEKAPSHQAWDVCTAVCKDYCNSGAEIPLQAFLLMSVSDFSVDGFVCCLFFWFLKLFYHSKVFPSLSTPFPATSLKFNTTEHSQTAHCTKHWHALVSETEQLLLTVFTFSAKVLSKWCIHMFTVYCLLLWHHLFLKPWCPPSASCRLILPPSFLT